MFVLLIIFLLCLGVFFILSCNCSKKVQEKYTRTPQQLWDKYNEIFPNQNRNAAAHRWLYEIMKNADKMTKSEFTSQVQSFCPVSGSPISGNGASFKLKLKTTKGDFVNGVLKHCCWPCACDIVDANTFSSLRIHQDEVKLKDKTIKVNFIVMDDPCKINIQIPDEAPDVSCSNEKELINSIKFNTEEGEKIAIGVFHDTSDIKHNVNKFSDIKIDCRRRARNNYKSGMGDMFRIISKL